MERLTKRGTRKNGYVSAIGSGSGCWGRIIDRLAAYEDTGLEPNDVTDLMAAHGTAIGALAEYRALGTVKKLRALVDAPSNTPLTLEELREIVEQLEFCGYKCEGGPLNMNRAFIRLKELAYRCKPEEG